MWSWALSNLWLLQTNLQRITPNICHFAHVRVFVESIPRSKLLGNACVGHVMSMSKQKTLTFCLDYFISIHSGTKQGLLLSSFSDK